MIAPTLVEFRRMTGRGIALVDFDLPWCASSRIQERIIKALARRFSGSAAVVSVNVDKIRPVALEMDIHHVPTLVLFREGKEIRRFVGLQPEEMLVAAIENALRNFDLQ